MKGRVDDLQNCLRSKVEECSSQIEHSIGVGKLLRETEEALQDKIIESDGLREESLVLSNSLSIADGRVKKLQKSARELGKNFLSVSKQNTILKTQQKILISEVRKLRDEKMREREVEEEIEVEEEGGELPSTKLTNVVSQSEEDPNSFQDSEKSDTVEYSDNLQPPPSIKFDKNMFRSKLSDALKEEFEAVHSPGFLTPSSSLSKIASEMSLLQSPTSLHSTSPDTSPSITRSVSLSHSDVGTEDRDNGDDVPERTESVLHTTTTKNPKSMLSLWNQTNSSSSTNAPLISSWINSPSLEESEMGLINKNGASWGIWTQRVQEALTGTVFIEDGSSDQSELLQYSQDMTDGSTSPPGSFQEVPLLDEEDVENLTKTFSTFDVVFPGEKIGLKFMAQDGRVIVDQYFGESLSSQGERPIEGDVVVGFNSTSIEGWEFKKVGQTLKEAGRPLTLTFLRSLKKGEKSL